MHARIRHALAALLLVATGCSCSAARTEVRWPASPQGSNLARELAATARREGRPAPISASGRRIEGENLPPDAPGIHARSFVFDGLWVAEIVLGEAPDDAELPLVVMFHGRGDRPRLPGGPFGRVPTAIRVLVPRGPLALGSGFAWARNSVTQGRHEQLAADLVGITDRLVRLIDHVQRTRPTAGSPIVTGFSQGAIVAWTLAIRYPDRIGLAIPMAGWVVPGTRPRSLRAPPTRAIHGTADPIVRIEPTREWVRQLQAAGNDVTWVELEGVAHVVTPEMNVQFEEWLEEAVRERAPALAGGLGLPGIDPEPIEPHDPPAEVDLDAEAVPAPLPDDVIEPHVEEPAPGVDEIRPPEDDDEQSPDEQSPDEQAPMQPGEPSAREEDGASEE